MRASVLLLALLFAGHAEAEQPNPEIQDALAVLDAQTHCYAFPGPQQGETRAVCVWRPHNVGPGTALPVLYMADGMAGLHIALQDLSTALDAGSFSPMMVVAISPKEKSEDRANEYLQTRSSLVFDAHETWLLDQVIPWAERTQGAARERTRRFIGGYSNGADLALWIANKHPDVFGGALLHSPFGASASWVGDQAGSQRWVVTGGTQETTPGSILHTYGFVNRGAQLPRDIVQALEHKSAAVRVCIGSWKHDPRVWRQLSPGSLVWLLGLGAPENAESPFERGRCRNEP